MLYFEVISDRLPRGAQSLHILLWLPYIFQIIVVQVDLQEKEILDDVKIGRVRLLK